MQETENGEEALKLLSSGPDTAIVLMDPQQPQLPAQEQVRKVPEQME